MGKVVHLKDLSKSAAFKGLQGLHAMCVWVRYEGRARRFWGKVVTCCRCKQPLHAGLLAPSGFTDS
jgi:hypothetical protein